MEELKCGNQVSDNASESFNCGYPVDEILDIKEQEEQEKQQQIKLQKKSIFGKRIKYLIALVVAIAFGVIVAIVANQPDRTGLFDGNKWGTSIDKIESKYPDGYRGSDNTEEESSYLVKIDNYEKIDGASALVVFKFDEDGLYKIFVFVTTDDDVLPNYKEQQIIKHQLIDLYGEPDDESVYSSTWETEKSNIKLWNYKSLISIEYKELSDSI